MTTTTCISTNTETQQQKLPPVITPQSSANIIDFCLMTLVAVLGIYLFGYIYTKGALSAGAKD